ncbi:Abi family protein, partial [Desulfovibrio desulfuricans]
VYYFDKEIKGIFFKTIMEIEKHIKSIIAYVFSEEHQEDFSYLNAKSFKNNDIIDVTQTIACLSKIITRKQREKDDNSV